MMSTRAAVVFSSLTLVLSLSACDSDPPIRISRESAAEVAGEAAPLKVISALQCPQTENVLTRRGGPAADGRSCEYSGPRGALVSLRLINADGDMAAALQSLEQEVQAELPDAIERVGGARPNGGGDGAVEVTGPGMQIRSQGDSATVRMPGISIDTDGSQAHVRIGGLRISADDSREQVELRNVDESVSIRAQDNAAEIRTRAPGDGVRSTYILVDERGSEAGWRLVGYEARGPSSGPLVVAVVRSRDRQEGEVFNAAKALVRLNVGG